MGNIGCQLASSETDQAATAAPPTELGPQVINTQTWENDPTSEPIPTIPPTEPPPATDVPPPTEPPLPTETPDIVENLVSKATLVSLPTSEASTATPRPTRKPEPTPTLSADDPAFDGTSIDELSERIYGQGWFTFTETITRNETYLQFTFEYLSDTEVVEGFLTMPTGTGEYREKFPAVVLLHGYVNPEEYETFAYTTRYVMDFVEAGYIVVHPSYRGHPPKPNSSWQNVFRIEYAIDVLNIMAMMRTGAEDLAGPFRRVDQDNVFLWGHSMGGGIAQRVLTVRPDWVSAAVLYASMSGDEARNYERIRGWGDERTWRVEYFAPPEVIKLVSPITYLDRWQAPISIHHGDIDPIVPPEWSRELCAELEARRHPVECFEYFNYRHNLYGSAEDVFMARSVSFFNANKSP